MKSRNLYVVLFVLIIFATKLTGQNVSTVISATIQDVDRIEVETTDKIHKKEFTPAIQPRVKIQSINKHGNMFQLHTERLDLSNTYYLLFQDQKLEIQPGDVFNRFYTDEEMGCSWNAESTTFRLFAPRAKNVILGLFEHATDEIGTEYPMQKNRNGVWELNLESHYFGKYYAYQVDGPDSPTEDFNANAWLADPYSRAVATENNYLARGKTLIIEPSRYDWEKDTWTHIDQEDLIIYECHMRDMTAHPSAGAPDELAGSYKAFIQNGIRGGLEHLKSLGINAVEFLPIHDFGNIEIPYQKEVDGVVNTWNPYERNHWGYMTSYFFAPESYYASEQRLTPGGMCGADGRQIFEFKDVVKACHQQGIAVILDVVYNHVSQYDQNCFKHIDKKYYFRLKPDQTYCSASGCGNDFKTERPMARKMIVESIKFWMTEYHIDGFRFDLAAMLDWKTVDAITKAAREINPDVILIAEPWGGGEYEPAKFSKHDWAAWNDQIRNGVKGQNPYENHGFIFGHWFDSNNRETMKKYIVGTLERDGGLFQKKAHAVNYLESHDDHTFGDFVRIGLGGSEKVEDRDKNARLNAEQMRVNKLGALFLFVSQGPVMIHAGQEWARSKVIAPTDAPENAVGHIDHNSYNKDNETNWLNYTHADMNSGLVNYYQGLIALRKQHPAFRRSTQRDIKFYDATDNEFAFAFHLGKKASGDSHHFYVALNGGHKSATFSLPKGQWSVIVNADKAGTAVLYRTADHITVPPTSGMILMQG